MEPFFENGVARLYHADARHIPLPYESVHCAITSPPYWFLRDYGLAPSVWGGDPDCNHDWSRSFQSPGERSSDDKSGSKQLSANRRDAMPTSAYCRCGAWSGTLGLEPTPDLFVEHIVEVFREVWRVLRKDGTVWLNMGDSYAANRSYQVTDNKHINVGNESATRVPDGLKPKDLVGMPWRVAFALQADGWWLRSPIIWAKPNPMPESVSDRPTTSHEYLFLLSKAGASTYWTHRDLPGTRTQPTPDYRWTDQAAGIEYEAEPAAWSDELIDCPDCEGNGEFEITFGQSSMFDGPPTLVKICSRCNHADAESPGLIPSWKRVNLWRGHDYYYDADAIRSIYAESSATDPRDNANGQRRERDYPGANTNGGTNLGGNRAGGANARTVWTIATQPYKGAHFATFPEDLPRICILAGTSEHGVCAQCGAAWERCVERTGHINKREPAHAPNNYPTKTDSTGWSPTTRATDVWQPTCACDAAVIPATVLDPFAGSGTTLAVAQKLGRRGVGLDLSKDYLALAAKRIRAVSLTMILEGAIGE